MVLVILVGFSSCSDEDSQSIILRNGYAVTPVMKQELIELQKVMENSALAGSRQIVEDTESVDQHVQNENQIKPYIDLLQEKFGTNASSLYGEETFHELIDLAELDSDSARSIIGYASPDLNYLPVGTQIYLDFSGIRYQVLGAFLGMG